MKNTEKPIIIGAVHLPYYGRNNPSRSIDEIEEYILTNVHVFYDNGIPKVYIQDENLNEGIAEPETIALMSSLGRLIRTEMPKIELGIIIQSHDGTAPIAIAHACGASFVRIKVFSGAMLKSEGIRNGVGVEAVKYRTQINSSVKIYADVHDREGFPMLDVPIANVAGWAAHTGADGLILTGKTYAQTLEYLNRVNAADIGKPLIVGGSVNSENIHEILTYADGAVVSTSLMLEGEIPKSQLHWDAEKVKKFAERVSEFHL